MFARGVRKIVARPGDQFASSVEQLLDVVGHLVERRREIGDLGRAGLGRAGGQIALRERARCVVARGRAIARSRVRDRGRRRSRSRPTRRTRRGSSRRRPCGTSPSRRAAPMRAAGSRRASRARPAATVRWAASAAGRRGRSPTTSVADAIASALTITGRACSRRPTPSADASGCDGSPRSSRAGGARER